MNQFKSSSTPGHSGRHEIAKHPMATEQTSTLLDRMRSAVIGRV